MNFKKIAYCLITSMVLLPIICVAGYTAEPSQTIPMQNAGFEKGLTGWGVRAQFKNQVSIETTTVHSGAQALKVDATATNNRPYVTYNTKAEGGAAYEFSIWARVAPGAPAVRAALKMESYSATANNSGKYSYINLPADGAWKQITVQKQVPADTVRCSFLLRVFGQSAVIFDDATLTMVAHAPDVSILAPTEVTLKPGGKNHLTYQLSLRQPWTEKDLPLFTAHLQALDGTGKVLLLPAVAEQAKDNRHYTASFNIPELAVQDYTVNFEYQQKDETLQTAFPAYLFTALTQRQPKSLTDDGTMLWHGKPFFPIGMYHASREGDYKMLHDNGFNAVQGTASLDLDVFKTKLDLAQKYGLAVDVPLYSGRQVEKNLANSLEKIKRFADHPAVLSWKIFDEPHISINGGAAVGIPAAYRALKSADPNHPLELTLNSAATQQFWSDYCDIVQVDVYPLPSQPITDVAERGQGAMKAMQPWQNLSFVLQCGWLKDVSNQPSVAQARSMVYMALINGAKGIWWYSMRESSGWDLTKTPLWPHMKEINAEIKVLSQPLMLGKVVDNISCDQPKVLFRAVEYQNKTYLLVTNPEKEPMQVTFTLPGSSRSYRLIDSDTKSEVKNQIMNLSLRGVDSRTYILEK